MTDDLQDPLVETLKVGFDDRVHQSFSHLGIAPEGLRLERELRNCGFRGIFFLYRVSRD